MPPDNSTHNQGVSSDTWNDLRQELDVIMVTQRRITDHEAPDQKVTHPYQHAHTQQVGQEAKNAPRRRLPQELEAGQIPLRHIHQVHQQIVDKAPGNKIVEEGGDPAVAMDSPLVKKRHQATLQPVRQVLKVKLSLPPLHNPGHLAKGYVSEIERGENSQKEQ